MKKVTIAAVALATLGVSSIASAQLHIDVSGVAGSGVTTWTFSGTGTVTTSGTVRDNTANTFSASDTGQFPFGQDTILNTTYQNMVFAMTGSASITIGADTQSLSGIFLDDDGGSADDLGVRAATSFDYLAGETSSWTGTGTVNVDINDFALGDWSINSTDGQAMFFGDPVTVKFAAVPEPATMAVLGLGALALLRKKRK